MSTKDFSLSNYSGQDSIAYGAVAESFFNSTSPLAIPLFADNALVNIQTETLLEPLSIDEHTVLADAVTLVVDQLANTAASTTQWQQLLTTSFDSDYSENTSAENFRQHLLPGEATPLMSLEVVDELTQGGAYSAAGDRLFIARNSLTAGNTDTVASIIGEEIGHWFDDQLNVTDAQGDEGEIFSRTLFGEQLDSSSLSELRQEDDFGIINLNGEELEVEFNRKYRPDLVISSAYAPSNVTVGNRVNLSVYTKNQGRSTAGYSYTRYWLSNDTKLDSSDRLLTTDYVGSLRSGRSERDTHSFTYNASYGTGTKYIIFQADATNRVSETSGTNNTTYRRMTVANNSVKPDLVISSAYAPSNVTVGNRVNLSVYTKNQGSSTAGYSYTRYWLSNDTKLDSSDRLLTTDYVGSLRSGRSERDTHSFTYNASYGTGTKYIIFQADATNRVNETSGTNNTTYRRMTVANNSVKPDLVISSAYAPSNVTVGNRVNLSVYTKNQGSSTAGYSYTRYWLSNDTKLDSSDRLLTTDYVGSLRSGRLERDTHSFTYNASYGTGTKYIIFQADATNRVSETSDTNNTTYRRLTVNNPATDLYISGAYASGNVTVGNRVNLSVYTKNQGSSTAGSSHIRYWLSNDTKLDSSDRLLATDYVGSLGAGRSERDTHSFTYNASYGTGTKYIIFQADATNRVSETSEANNFAYRRLTAKGVDWFSQNLSDAQLISKTRSLASDGELSRQDMIDIFRNAGDRDVIDSNELKDLRTIIENSRRFSMEHHVKVLSNKIVNGDDANKNSGIGNLQAGSQDGRMENLIQKWFLGKNRPDPLDESYKYHEVKGSLFKNGISYEDIGQGQVGDCYFLAALASIARRSSNMIEGMFIDNGDKTYTVRFDKRGTYDYVTVDRWLPTTSSGKAIYASWGGGHYTDTTNELWVALAEKAYAQIHESGWLKGPASDDHINSYTTINGGNPGKAITDITGIGLSTQQLPSPHSWFLNSERNAIADNFTYYSMVVFASKANVSNSSVVAGHAYTLVDYDKSTKKFKLFNPWGIDGGQGGKRCT